MKINWQDWAIDQIQHYYECPVCTFKHDFKNNVESHIRDKHTAKEIKEICSD